MADRFFMQTVVGSKTPVPKRLEGESLADSKLPEGIDFSEGGWATDFAASLLGFLFLIAAADFYDEEDQHWMWIFGGTGVAHLFGGLAHRFFSNRALEGVGNYGFYICMIPGYAGNCFRYGFGWDLGEVFEWIGIANAAYLLVTGILVMITMKPTTLMIDDVPQGNKIFFWDRLFATGEAFCSLMEVVTSIYYAATNELHYYEVVAIVINILGWLSVYAVGGLYALTGLDYDPSLMQRIFHYCMIIMMWAINAYVQEGDRA